MSWIDAYLPEDDGQYNRCAEQQERRDAAIDGQEAYLWDSAIDPLVADKLVTHSEVGADSVGSLLCLAAYAKGHGKEADKDWVIDRLIQLFSEDMHLEAVSIIDHKGY